MGDPTDLLLRLLSQGPKKPRERMAALGNVSQPTLSKFSLAEPNPITQRWRDLLLAEHHALETLRDASAETGIPAAASRVHDHQGQRFLEVERFDRVGAKGRRGLVSLAALDAEYVGQAREPWPVLVRELVRQQVVQKLGADDRLSSEFGPCVAALQAQLVEAERRIALLG